MSERLSKEQLDYYRRHAQQEFGLYPQDVRWLLDHIDAVENDLWAKDERIAEVEAQKNNAYSERNKLVALLASMFPSSLERHPDEDTTWEDDWRWVVYIDFPTGQVSWHIHDSELPLFVHLPRFQGRKWDGHTTPEKYERVIAATRGVGMKEGAAHA